MIPVPLPYIAAFERLGYGMFVHWGPYSQPALGEKSLHVYIVPKEAYHALMQTFTAERFDGRELARFAASMGMNYIPPTARHHDGFSLYAPQFQESETNE